MVFLRLMQCSFRAMLFPGKTKMDFEQWFSCQLACIPNPIDPNSNNSNNRSPHVSPINQKLSQLLVSARCSRPTASHLSHPPPHLDDPERRDCERSQSLRQCRERRRPFPKRSLWWKQRKNCSDDLIWEMNKEGGYPDKACWCEEITCFQKKTWTARILLLEKRLQ